MKSSVFYQSFLNEYLKWMKDICNLGEETLKSRHQYLIRFLEWLDTDLTLEKLLSLSPEKIQTFFLDYSKKNGYGSRRLMQTSLRTFFRFCLSRGYITQNLAEAIPTLRTYKLSTLPRGIEDKDAQRLLSGIDRSTNAGKRDYAIIQMLYTYGVRGGQVRMLCLDDINWEQNKIRFPASKYSKECILPLTDNVGESLLDYLQHSRPDVPYSEVFLKVHAPYCPIRVSTTLSAIVTRRMRVVGIKSPTLAAHALRHCFASRMLKQEHSLKFIADMLGHRCIKTTFIYTKVDFKILNQIPLEWPEDVS